LLATLTDEDHELMGYNIIMLEHSLCKFTGILSKGDKPRKTSSLKKPSKVLGNKKTQGQGNTGG
jgi:hypothetical protein